jgi:hypothetical protein
MITAALLRALEAVAGALSAAGVGDVVVPAAVFASRPGPGADGNDEPAKGDEDGGVLADVNPGEPPKSEPDFDAEFGLKSSNGRVAS